MGVRTTDYVLIGADIGTQYYDDERMEEDEAYEEMFGNRNEGEIVYLLDGYSDKYFIIGEILYSKKEGGGISFGKNAEFEGKEYTEQIERVKEHIKKEFGTDVEPKLISFTHKA